MRILILASSYPPRVGGLETAVSSLAKEWQAAGREVEVVAQRYPRSLLAQEILEGVPVSRRMFLTAEWEQIQRGRADLFLAGLYYRFASQRWLEEKIRAFAPDVVNLHFPDSQIPFLLKARKKINFKLVVSLHGHDVERWFQGNKTSSRKYAQFAELLRSADFVAACSRSLLERAKMLLPEIETKSAAIPNGVDVARFENAAYSPEKTPYLLAVGRLTFVKGFDLLLPAFAEVAQDVLDLQLWIAGSGEEESALKTKAQNLGVAQRVRFLGQVASVEIPRLLHGCRALAIPSRSESFGVAALEGLAAGKPVVASRVGGLIEILQGTPNFLVEPSAPGLAEGVRQALGADVTIIVQANRQRARQYAWDAAARRYLKIFETITA